MSANTLMAHDERQTKIPLSAVLALATAVFGTSLTETLPAGLLPRMSAGLGVSESAAGQTVTLYAIGTALTTIPLTAATAHWRRKRLLLTAITGFLIANTVTALSSSYLLTMGARFVAGIAAGVAWALLAGYARRISPPHLQGRALAIAMAGIPVALSLGVPAGAFIGQLFGWRVPFLLMSVLAVVLLGWLGASVPDYPGVPLAERPRVLHALRVNGVAAVLVVTLVFVIAHTVLYTYISTYLRSGSPRWSASGRSARGSTPVSGHSPRPRSPRCSSRPRCCCPCIRTRSRSTSRPCCGGSDGAACPPCCRPRSATPAANRVTRPKRCW
jgi:predicted MFS family arabinose efflux permease